MVATREAMKADMTAERKVVAKVALMAALMAYKTVLRKAVLKDV